MITPNGFGRLVDLDEEGRVQQIIIRPLESSLRYTWGIALWRPAFTHFLLKRKVPDAADPELCMGDVFQAAIRTGLLVEGLAISSVPDVDIGTPEDLIKTVRRFAL